MPSSYRRAYEERQARLDDIIAKLNGCSQFERTRREISGLRWMETAEDRNSRIRREALFYRIDTLCDRRCVQ